MKLVSLLVLAVLVLGLAPSTAALNPGPALPPEPALVQLRPQCVQVYDFPDNGLAYCVDFDGPCYVKEIRQTFIGPVETCLVGAA